GKIAEARLAMGRVRSTERNPVGTELSGRRALVLDVSLFDLHRAVDADAAVGDGDRAFAADHQPKIRAIDHVEFLGMPRHARVRFTGLSRAGFDRAGCGESAIAAGKRKLIDRDVAIADVRA